jgi:hypothetical protein
MIKKKPGDNNKSLYHKGKELYGIRFVPILLM